MTEPTTPQLTEEDVREIEAIASSYRIDWRYPNFRQQVAALIRDWKAMRAYAQFCDDRHAGMAEDLGIYRNKIAALREQLAEAESEVRGVLDVLGKEAIHSHPDGGTENIYESLAISVARLQSQLAQVTSERDALKRGEFICQRCHLRKDTEFDGAHRT